MLATDIYKLNRKEFAHRVGLCSKTDVIQRVEFRVFEVVFVLRIDIQRHPSKLYDCAIFDTLLELYAQKDHLSNHL
jgi:hypothetical protein